MIIKRSIRALAALAVAALALPGLGVSAEAPAPEVALEEISLAEDLPQAEEAAEGPELLLELDGALLDGDEADGSQAPARANDSGDFSLDGDLLVSYNGDGGSVSIPGSVRRIGSSAFYGRSDVTGVSIPGSVREICDGYDNPDSSEYVGAFAYCRNLVSLSIARGIEYIGYNAFLHCTAIQSIVLPDTVTVIGNSAFWGCDSLPSFTVPASVTRIEKDAFYDCDELKDVTILARDITIDPDAFNQIKPTLHIASGSDAVAWAKKYGFSYDIIGGSLNKTSLSLAPGKTYQLKVKGYSGKVTWSSSNKKVATVSSGKVKAVAAGKCTVTAKLASGRKLKCTVTVSGAKLSAKTLTLSTVDTATLKLTGAAGQTVKWASSRSAVAKITKSSAKSATIKGVKAGSSVISAKVGGKTLKCSVKVVNPLKLSVDALEQLAGDNILHIRFANQSAKKITYVKFDVLQYDGQGRRLESPYAYYDSSKAVKAHGATVARVYVNGSTVNVKFKISEVRFSDGTTWRP